MKREILFRGYQRELKKWVYGDLVHTKNGGTFIFSYENNFEDRIEVYPESVGQFTGFMLPDKDGKKIKVFEDDIIEFDRIEWGSSKDVFFLVSWNAEEGELSFGGGVTKEDMEFRTLVGNRFDNPELLKK